MSGSEQRVSNSFLNQLPSHIIDARHTDDVPGALVGLLARGLIRHLYDQYLGRYVINKDS